MGFADIFLIGVALSMDAFAVSICKGLSVQKVQLKHMLIAGLYFGAFQALMPLIGYLLGFNCRISSMFKVSFLSTRISGSILPTS